MARFTPSGIVDKQGYLRCCLDLGAREALLKICQFNTDFTVRLDRPNVAVLKDFFLAMSQYNLPLLLTK